MNTNDPRLGRLPWAMHPWPRADELLVSWIVRFAEANLITPRRLIVFMARMPVKDVQSFDILIREHQKTLSRVSGIQLHQIERLVREQPPLSKTALTYRCCLRCLVEDVVPYLRSRWMQPETVFCVRHRTPLSDRCARCGSLWTWKIFGAPDRPLLSDLLRCSNPKCLSGVMHSDFGTLAEGHGAIWLQAALSHPKQPPYILLPCGKRVERQLLQDMLAHFSFLHLTDTALPFDVEEGLYPWRNFDRRQVLHSELFFAQLLVQPPWIWEEALTTIAERLARNSAYRRQPPVLSPVSPLSSYRSIPLLLFFGLIYDSELQVIDRDVMFSHDFSGLLRTFERTLGLNGEGILKQIPDILLKFSQP